MAVCSEPKQEEPRKRRKKT